MTYLVWDTDGGNLVAECTTELEARTMIERLVMQGGGWDVRHLVIEQLDDDGTITVIKQGEVRR